MGRFRHGAQDWRKLGQTGVGQAVRGGRGVTRSGGLLVYGAVKMDIHGHVRKVTRAGTGH